MDRDDVVLAGVESFCQSEYPRLVRLLSLYCGDRESAEDLAQETLARVWRRWDRVAAMDAPELWARRVALNLATSLFRRRHVARQAAARLRSRDGVTDGTADPAQEFLRMIQDLAPRQRAVLVLRFYEDRSVADTAHVMRIREGTVKALSSQALDALRRQATVMEESCDD